MDSVTLYFEVIEIIKRDMLGDECISDQKVLSVATDSSGSYTHFGRLSNAKTVDLMQAAYEAGLRYRCESKITINEIPRSEDEDY